MAQDPGIGYRVKAPITDIKGECGAGHRVGETFKSAATIPAACRLVSHDIFPGLTRFSSEENSLGGQ